MSSRTYCLITVTMFVTFGSDVFADKETSIAGQQLIIARYTNTPAVIDGVFAPGEWSAAIPVHVKANHPATAPGLVPNLPDLLLFPPDNQDDSSYTIYTMYDDDNLYVAVNVADDIRINDGPVAFLDDDVELFIDGDKQPFDLLAALGCGQSNPDCPEPVINNEGFQILTSVGGDRATLPDNNPAIVWESKTGPRPRGFLAEFRIPLDSINTGHRSCATVANIYGLHAQVLALYKPRSESSVKGFGGSDCQTNRSADNASEQYASSRTASTRHYRSPRRAARYPYRTLGHVGVVRAVD